MGEKGNFFLYRFVKKSILFWLKLIFLFPSRIWSVLSEGIAHVKDIEDDDPTLVELMLGGGLKPDTVQAKERMFKHFNEFVKKNN